MTSEEKDEEMICGLTADERGALQRGLNELPQTMPPRAVWQRVREQAEAEGLLQRPMSQRPATWYSGLGLAAAVVLAVIILPKVGDTPLPDATTVPQVATDASPVELNAVQALMAESRQLESDLRSLPEEPRVMRVATAATLSELEDRIAAIDYQLNDPSVQMTRDEKEIFWRERVRLMKSLVQLRYAQAQRAAF